MPYDDSALLAALNKKPDPNQLATLQQKIMNPINQDAAGNQFRFDPGYAANLRNLQERFAGINSSEELANRRLGEDYTTSKTKLGTSNQDTLKRLSEKLANSGLGRSGINIAAQGEIGQAYQDDLNTLGTGTARSLEDIQRQITGQRQDVLTDKDKIDADRTRSETDWRIQDTENKAKADAEAKALETQTTQFETLRQQVMQALQPVTSPTGQIGMSPAALNPSLLSSLNPGGGAAGGAASGGTSSGQGASGSWGEPPAQNNQAMANGALQQAMQQFKTPMQIRALQSYLKSQGFDPGGTDGSFGPKTKAAWLAHYNSLAANTGSQQNLQQNWSGVL